jgi:hypothetical protein
MKPIALFYGNLDTPIEILERLTRDRNYIVRVAIVQHPNVIVESFRCL